MLKSRKTLLRIIADQSNTITAYRRRNQELVDQINNRLGTKSVFFSGVILCGLAVIVGVLLGGQWR